MHGGWGFCGIQDLFLYESDASSRLPSRFWDSSHTQWLVIPAAATDTFIFTNQFTNTSALTEYCEDSPVIAASPRDATPFEIIEAQVPGVYSVRASSEIHIKSLFSTSLRSNTPVRHPRLFGRL